jgi:hypothetical protein
MNQNGLHYLDAVLTYNRAQFRLFRALGQAPLVAPYAEPPAGTGRGEGVN